MKKILTKFKPKREKNIQFIIFIFFIITFAVSRFIVYFLPGFHLFNTGTGGHIHHFTYGFILLSLIGYFSLITDLNQKNRLRLAVLYGIGLGMAYDEFAMWLELRDIYFDQRSYDAVLFISLLLLNMTYFTDFWKNNGRRIYRLFKILISPKEIPVHKRIGRKALWFVRKIKSTTK